MLALGGKFLNGVSNAVKDQLAHPWDIKVTCSGEHQTTNGRDMEGATRPCTLLAGEDPVAGSVEIVIKSGRIIEHSGVQVLFLGFIESVENPEFSHTHRAEFLHLSRDVAPTGKLEQGSHKFDFDFGMVEKPHESYHGRYVSLRYVVRVTVFRGFVGDATFEEEVVVQLLKKDLPEPDKNPPIQMEVGVQDCLHISFMYQSSHYPMGSILTGCIGFAVVRLHLVSMETSIIRVEVAEPREPGLPKLVHHQVIAKTEVMDGIPGRAERVPLRWPLKGMDVSPTYAYPGRFSVKYYIKLVLVDERGRQFFKQCEIFFHRGELGGVEPTWFADDGNNKTWQDSNSDWQESWDEPASPGGAYDPSWVINDPFAT
ncbi:vacuolar protein sorting-associated protein 26-domain-containing protein [Baffinella frigidus]|nr:vacuolar protein sorting-associated protein 26-domain-containing protein [Cryptophyta sp. CCMP2293]